MTETAVGRGTAPLSPEEAAAGFTVEERMLYWNAHPGNRGRVYPVNDATATMPRSSNLIRRAARGEESARFTRALFEQDAQPRSPNFHRTVPNWETIQANIVRTQRGEEPLIDVDDPRVRHLFVDAARTAIEHDWCPVYDEVASQSGVPTRAQLRATGELESGTSVRFRLELPFYERFVGARSAAEAIERMTYEEKRALAHRLVDRMSEEEFRRALVVYDSRSF